MSASPRADASASATVDHRAAPLRFVFLGYAVLASSYMLWRFHSTLSLEHPIFGITFYLAEFVGVISSLVFYRILCGVHRSDVAPPPRSEHSVDVFVTTYDESLELVRSTVVAARDMHYPHATWICDDGRRPEMRALADDLGVGYITRRDNADFKAGNLNHAMTRTTGELIVVLDADHLLSKNFLTALLGYFDDDPKLALVQIPQVYYNVDSYQHSVSARRGMLWHEASLFHHRMQPGADAYDAAFFVGTGAILRRSALEKVAGFATESITEDIHTSIRLHAAGYSTRYVDRRLGYLLAPDTPLAYACQRLRWAQGAMQVLRSEPGLWRRGLRFSQRVSYLNSLLGYLLSYQHLVFYLAPGIFLYTGVSPISVDPELGFPIFVAYIAFSLALYKTIAAPEARLFLGECYKMLNLAIHIRGSLSLVWPSGPSFRVTPKGEHDGLPLFVVIPVLLLFLFNLTAVGAGVVQIVHGSRPLGGVILATAFSSFFAIAGALGVLHALERRSNTEPFAFPVCFPAALRGSSGHEIVAAKVRRLNHQVVYLSMTTRVPDQEIETLDLSQLGIEKPIRVHPIELQAARHLGNESWVMKLSLEPLSGIERDSLDRYVLDEALPAFFARFDEKAASPSTDTGEAWLLADDFRYLPIRSGIV